MSGTPSPAPALALIGVTRIYQAGAGTVTALNNLDLTLPAGSYAALMGRSGSGKSTLLNVLCGIDRPTSGTVAVFGTAVHSLSEPALTHFRRRTFGFIFQFFNLLPTLTVLENVLLPGQLEGQPSAMLRERAATLLADLGLADRLHEWPDRLSGGEQQRVAIARALINDPPLLLADEPTGNLDSETGAEVLNLLERLHREQGKTILLVTHAPEAAARAERILTLHDGRIAPEGG